MNIEKLVQELETVKQEIQKKKDLKIKAEAKLEEINRELSNLEEQLKIDFGITDISKIEEYLAKEEQEIENLYQEIQKTLNDIMTEVNNNG